MRSPRSVRAPARPEAGVEVDCGAEAELVCTGVAPMFDCRAGTCSGSCVQDLSVAAGCEGTCRGTCLADVGAIESFEGRCDGTCQGECAVDMSAGGQCDFNCEGSCEYTPPEGRCETTATAPLRGAGGSLDRVRSGVRRERRPAVGQCRVRGDGRREGQRIVAVHASDPGVRVRMGGGCRGGPRSAGELSRVARGLPGPLRGDPRRAGQSRSRRRRGRRPDRLRGARTGLCATPS